MPRKNWAPNPYAIARLLNGRAGIKFLQEASGKDADDFLKKAFHLRDKERTLIQALEPFRDLADAVNEPLPLAKVRALEQYKELRKDVRYTDAQIQRVLPLLVQVSDATFGFALGPAPAGPIAAVGALAQAGLLEVDQATYLDPIQGDTADCYLISAMIGLAWANPNLLRATLLSTGFVAGSFKWQFHSDPPAPLNAVSVTGQVPQDGDFPLFARSSEPTEYWPSLIEKAYVVKLANENRHVLPRGEPSPANYQFIANKELPQNACRALVGGTAQADALDTLPGTPGQKIFVFSQDNRRGALGTESGVMNRPVMVWRDSQAADSPSVWEDTGLVPDHAYTVLGVMQSAEIVEHVVLRNPYGYQTDASRPGFKSGLWKPDGRDEVNLNKNGVLAISRELFYRHFNNIGWVDLSPGGQAVPQPDA